MIPLRDDNPSYSFPFVTIILIAINAFVFLFMLALNIREHTEAVFSFGMIPVELIHGIKIDEVPLKEIGTIYPKHVPTFATIFTSMFMHGGFMHILGNMWFLWLFGDNVEDRMGKIKFIIFYLLTGVIAALAHALVASHSVIPTVGASGAISGVIGAYIVLFPRAQIQTLVFFFFITVIRIPAMIFLGFWFIGQVYSGFMSLGYQGAGVAFFAHIGGFVAGVILVKLFAKRQLVQVPRRPARYDRWSSYRDDDYEDIWY